MLYSFQRVGYWLTWCTRHRSSKQWQCLRKLHGIRLVEPREGRRRSGQYGRAVNHSLLFNWQLSESARLAFFCGIVFEPMTIGERRNSPLPLLKNRFWGKRYANVLFRWQILGSFGATSKSPSMKKRSGCQTMTEHGSASKLLMQRLDV